MCYRRVVVVLFDCGEQEPVAETKVDCGLRNCIYSANHNRDDGHDCRACNKWMDPPVTVDGPPRPGLCSRH
ncbi:hypothetical protein BJV77DRAFT_64493 [Russula vinacea]|nr:hypothetical protein BJV77DRAFT_64493 [Russula vinacea]